ncbi:unnamed protein product [Acanthosepion pharaonis]|uniref:Uncharacterized protein n=1 Tax=Acanthosepion pharaonis TaxID=158019 RepID=A0A812CTB3_ACAPH|nr:unnamed protein product [Sepia pharaonis]
MSPTSLRTVREPIYPLVHNHTFFFGVLRPSQSLLFSPFFLDFFTWLFVISLSPHCCLFCLSCFISFNCFWSWDRSISTSFFTVLHRSQVRTPILGADFLAHFNLSVNMSSLSLEDKTTNITRKGITSIYTSTCISATVPEANGMQDLLQKYSQITTPFRYTETVRHNAEHHINTTGPPTFISTAIEA